MEFKSKFIQSLNNEYFFIRDSNNKEIAYLSIVTDKDLDDLEFIQKITDWRKRFANCFFTVFEPKPERTRAWMERSLLPNPDRVLCKIFTTDMNLVGHVGIINHDSFVEYDYFIKGEKVDIKDFSLIVGIRFLKWVCEVSGINVIRAFVRSDNQKIIDFVQRTGFRLGERHPLKRNYLDPDEYTLEVDEDIINPEVYMIEIEMNADELHV